MSLVDMFKKKYTSTVWCNNCFSHQEVQIPKGVSIAQFIESAIGKCGNCGCNTLVAGYRQINEYLEPKVKLTMRKQQVEPSERAPLPQQRPSNRPANSLPPPKAKPIEPDFSLTPKGVFRDDIDFWTGVKKKKRDEKYENY